MTTSMALAEAVMHMRLSEVARTCDKKESQPASAAPQDHVMATTNDGFQPRSQAPSFLNLPLEIRLQIYQNLYLNSVDGEGSWKDKDLQYRMDISTARTALRRVSKKLSRPPAIMLKRSKGELRPSWARIKGLPALAPLKEGYIEVSQEWDPIFFLTAKIVVNNPKGHYQWSCIAENALQYALDGKDDEAQRLWSTVYGRGTELRKPANPGLMPSLNFDFGFLRTVSQHVLQNVRKMRYDYSHQRALGIGEECSRRNLNDLRYFATAIGRRYGQLEALEEITVSVPFFQDTNHMELMSILRGEVPWGRSNEDEKMRNSVQACFQSASGLDASKGWTAERRIRYEDKGTRESDYWGRVLIVQKVQILGGELVFGKAPQHVAYALKG
ncbi:hypothetical protein H2200_000143 [Cladophialophora chaetospira]|uniref:Uncharacterized protein n=1 Tax=Cladophialophora chaetospira TaxID=386627 RepID=A0AA38XMV4_9EURO|nr:hypothetical protein H2200_000143 [Cladophialophora chaetospira]